MIKTFRVHIRNDNYPLSVYRTITFCVEVHRLGWSIQGKNERNYNKKLGRQIAISRLKSDKAMFAPLDFDYETCVNIINGGEGFEYIGFPKFLFHSKQYRRSVHQEWTIVKYRSRPTKEGYI